MKNRVKIITLTQINNKNSKIMGKGDKKTAKGKRIMGSYGKVRKRKSSTGYTATPKSAEKEETVEKKAPAKKAPAKKAPAKTSTTTAKKPAAKKTTTAAKKAPAKKTTTKKSEE